MKLKMIEMKLKMVETELKMIEIHRNIHFQTYFHRFFYPSKNSQELDGGLRVQSLVAAVPSGIQRVLGNGFPGSKVVEGKDPTRCRLRRRGIGSKLLRNLCCDAEKSGFQKLSRLVKLLSQKQSSCGSSFTINLRIRNQPCHLYYKYRLLLDGSSLGFGASTWHRTVII